MENNNLLFKNGQVLCEVFKQKDLDNNYKNLIKIKEKKYGNKKIVIFKKIA